MVIFGDTGLLVFDAFSSTNVQEKMHLKRPITHQKITP